MGDIIAKFTSSPWMSGGKTGFRRRAQGTEEVDGVWGRVEDNGVVEPSEGEEAVDCVDC